MAEIPFPLVLMIIDGWGIRDEKIGNGYLAASKPNLSSFFAAYPSSVLLSAEEAVGLPKGQAGNSEVGHLNLGAGRIVYQEVLRINRSIADGSFWSNEALAAAVNHTVANKSKLHLLGLVSSGGVHSYLEHLYALLWFCKEKNLRSDAVKIHFIADGRDTPPTSARLFLAEVEQKTAQLGIGAVATVMGRYYAMDRDNRWERIKLAYQALVEGRGETVKSPQEAIDKAYDKGVTDEFIQPTIILDKQLRPTGQINDNDAVIFFNFRADRAKQLTKAFILSDFAEITAAESPIAGHEALEVAGFAAETKTLTKTFDRGKILKNLFFVTFTEYEKGLPVSAIAFPPQKIALPLPKVLADATLRQFHIAETEKYPHVTYFFGGGAEDPVLGEDRLMIPSAKVATYDLAPEMSAGEITHVLLDKIQKQVYDFIVVNYANFDMVAHTGKFEAAVQAVEAVDEYIGKLVSLVLSLGGGIIITSDHGNIEEMINPETGQIDTEHNKSPVPVIICWDKIKGKPKLKAGILADVAPTILEILNLQKPSVMSGVSLLD